MARLPFVVKARLPGGAVAAGEVYTAYTDDAGTAPADISLTSGGSAISGSQFTLDSLGRATIWGPTDGTSNLYVRSATDASLGVQEIKADADARLDTIEAASGIPASTVDAKGDLIAGTANNVVSRLAAGANDTVLTADSSTGTGLKWAAAAAHPNLATHDALGLATDAELATHAAAGDPHTGYQLESALPRTTAAQHGLLAEAYDAAASPMTSSGALTTGVIYLMRVYVERAITVTSIVYQCWSGGSSLTAGQNFMGIYDAAGTKLRETDSQVANWGAGGNKTGNLTSTLALSADSFYYVALLCNGTTGPAFARGSTASAPNAGLTAPFRFSTILTGQTTMPNLTLANAALINSALWVGLI